MDILIITVTWLKPHGDEGRLHDLTPAGYIAKSFPQESRGGDITVAYIKCLSKRISITAAFSFHQQSFKVIRLSIMLTSGNNKFFCLHRPPPSRNHQLTDSCFLSEFTFLLGQCNTLSSSSIILDDLNVQIYIPTNPLVLHRPNDDIVCSTTITQLLSSDHYCVVCDLSAIKSVNHAEPKQSGKLHGINLTTTKADIC